jgi:hypothetical protein
LNPSENEVADVELVWAHVALVVAPQRLLVHEGDPCKHVEVLFEEVDERAFLFRIERRPNTERPAIVGDDRILTSLPGSKEQAARLDDSGTSWSSGRGLAWSLSDRMVASVN